MHVWKTELAALSRAIRESSLKRLRAVPIGAENWRLDPEAMSFADTAQHLIDCDQRLFRAVETGGHARCDGHAHLLDVVSRAEYEDVLGRLEILGQRRSELLATLDDERLSAPIKAEVFGDVTLWWIIMRANLDHEIHHRGQLVAYLRVVNVRP
jgi:uncharacterized damage-inducible protein DinB